MGDVFCLSCSEGWDSYHMRWDFWYDMMDHGATEAECKEAARAFADTGTIPETARARLKEAGWELGSTVLTIKRCPGCKGKDVKPDTKKLAMAQGIEEALGGDTDGIQSMMEDMEV